VESYIATTLELMDQVLSRVKDWSIERRVHLALEAYKASQLIRIEHPIDAEEAHTRLQGVLKNAIGI
jgi:hypothetical protein